MRRNPLNPPPVAQLIEGDRSCPTCDYSLAGLHTGDKCPECGTLIPLTASDPRAGWEMADAGMGYLRNLGFGAVLTAMCVLPMALGVLWTMLEAPWENGLTIPPGAAACVASLAWLLGVWIITLPRPSRGDGISSTREWRGVRWWARATQLGWLFGLPLLMYGAYEFSPAGGAAAGGPNALAMLALARQSVALGLGLFLVAFIGLAPFALYMARLASWANDTTLSDRLRLVPYALGIGGTLLGILVFIRAGIGYKGGGMITVFVGSIASLFIIMAVLQFGAALFSFANLGRWSVASRQIRVAADARRSQRILERIEKSRAKPMDLEGAVLEGHKPAKPQGKVLEKHGDEQPYELVP